MSDELDWWSAPLPPVPVVDHSTPEDTPLYTQEQVQAAVEAAIATLESP